MTFSEYTRLKRNEAVWTQQFLADTLNLSNKSDISKREMGLVEWKWNEIIKLAQMYDQSISEFIREWEDS